MVSSDNPKLLRDWLCHRIGYTPTENIQCIGSVFGGIIRGVVGFDGYNGASIQMHVAGERGWLTRDLVKVCFDYAFNVCECNVVIGMVPSGNVKAIAFNKALGFRLETELKGAHPDGSLLMFVMYRRECRYLQGNSNGQEIGTSTAA